MTTDVLIRVENLEKHFGKDIHALNGVSAEIAGNANISAATSTSANAEGVAPGSLKGIEVSVSKMKAEVGTADDRQTAKVVIGDDTKLSADGELNITAKNSGSDVEGLGFAIPIQDALRIAAELKEYLANEHHILIRDASNFKGLTPHHFRVAAQTPEENNALVEAIKNFLDIKHA